MCEGFTFSQPREIFGAFGTYNTIFAGPLFVDTKEDYVRADGGYEIGLPPPGRYVLTVGTLEPRKNLVRLVRAYRRAAPPPT